MSKYNVAVLGPFPGDHITTHHGEVIEKYECAMYTAVGLSNLLERRGQDHLGSHVRKQAIEEIKSIIACFTNINTEFIRREADQGDVICLRFVYQNNRIEKQTGFMNSIVPQDQEGLMHCSAFVCVLISDYEVPLHTLQHIKANSTGVVTFDAHSRCSNH